MQPLATMRRIRPLIKKLDPIEEVLSGIWREIDELEPKSIKEERKQIKTIELIDELLGQVQESALEIRMIWSE